MNSLCRKNGKLGNHLHKGWNVCFGFVDYSGGQGYPESMGTTGLATRVCSVFTMVWNKHKGVLMKLGGDLNTWNSTLWCTLSRCLALFLGNGRPLSVTAIRSNTINSSNIKDIKETMQQRKFIDQSYSVALYLVTSYLSKQIVKILLKNSSLNDVLLLPKMLLHLETFWFLFKKC